MLENLCEANTDDCRTCLELAGIAKDVGLPRGVFNVITGLGPDAGAPLSSHPGVDKVSYLHSGLIPTNYLVYTAVFLSAFTVIREYVYE